MSTICRTCLQKSRRTFKANQTVTDFGGGEVKISMVLRFCMPELYLGLSSNPEICYTCKEHLKVSYLFKKNCLKTEKIIQNFLKNARCTGKSVDLHDVLGYVDEQKQLQEELEKAKDRITLNAQEIISEWDETSVEAINSDRIIPDIEVRQSAPNPVNSKADKLHKKNKMKFCHETGLFVDQQGQFYDCSGFRVDINELGKDRVINLEETTVDTVQVTKDCTDFIQDTEASENFCKITSVFSLSADTTSKDPVGDKNDASEVNVTDEVNDANNINKPNNVNAASNLIDASTLNDANNINKSQVNIKQESLEVEINGGQFNFNYYPTDEETLDASETASYEDVQSTSRLQGIIDNLPEISDTNQYIDVPEFVHINNFGLKELEELRRQQQSDGMLESKKIQLNFKNKLPTLSAMESSNSGEKETKSEESKDESTAEALSEVCLSAMPDTLLINGKRMVKCKEGYRLMEDPSSKPIQIRLGKAKKFVKRANSATQVEPDRKPATGRPVGRRKKIKIVPVNDKFKFCSQKGAKLDLKVGKASQNKNVKLLPGGDDKDVVVLFTNYTFDGEYINDHDYLVNPYKRNKILMDEGGQWICMCYICHTKHHVHSHIPHMQTHGSECKVCRVDFGTPYMLNVHVKSHSKPCGWCTERVPYGLKEKHEEGHFKDELEFENKKKKKVYHAVRGRPRKRSSKDDAVDTPDKPVNNTEPEPVKEEIKQPEEVNKFPFMDDTSSSESSDDEEWRKTASSSKKPRKRRRRRTKNDAEGLMVERSSRVLRSNVRKSYSETECEDIIANNLKLMSSTL